MNPQLAAEQRQKLSHEYMTFSDEMGVLEMNEAMFFVKADREVLKTDKSVQMAFNSSQDGQRLIYLKRHTKGMEKAISCLKTIIDVANSQSRNHY